MHAILVAFVGLLALSVIGRSAWRERSRPLRGKLAEEWSEHLRGISNAQEMGRFREARAQALRLCARADGLPADQFAAIRRRLRALLGNDPVYPAVLRAARKACREEPAVSELALCLGLRKFVIEDVRACVELAECFGQLRRKEIEGDPMVIARG